MHKRTHNQTHNGLTMDSQWTQTHNGLAMDSQWTHNGLTMDSPRTHNGLTKDSQRTHNRLTMDSHRIHTKIIEESLVLLCSPRNILIVYIGVIRCFADNPCKTNVRTTLFADKLVKPV